VSEPLVTIVTPSFNQAPFLRATIESVLSQDYPHIEYIVMDGGSTDASAAIAAEYGSRLKWISEKDRGQSHALNKGFAMAKGSILAWINSDDVLLEGAVRRAVDAFREKPEAGAVYGGGFLIDREGKVTRRFPYTRSFDLWNLVHLSDYVLQQSLYFRADVFREVGGLREDLHYTMDWDLLIRIGKKYLVQQIPHDMGCLREHAEAKTSYGGAVRSREIGRMMREHSGMRIPPGWVHYGLDTYRRICCGFIERWTPRRLTLAGEIAQMVVTFFFSVPIMLMLDHYYSNYQDGWAGPRTRFLLPARNSALIIEGELPGNPWLAGQKIEVLRDGQSVGTFALDQGKFRLRLPAGEGAKGELVQLEIRATHSYVPCYFGHPTDRRRLAYKIRQVSWEDWGPTPRR
jgi:hypothetical protein